LELKEKQKEKKLELIKRKNQEHYKWVQKAIWEKVNRKKAEIVEKYKYVGNADYSKHLSSAIDELLSFDQEYMTCLREEKEFNELTK
jgi:hypothetical protein